MVLKMFVALEYKKLLCAQKTIVCPVVVMNYLHATGVMFFDKHHYLAGIEHGMCVQRRFKSVCTSTQFDQSLSFPS